MTLYCIAEWNKRYENNRSRLIKKLDWVPVPNSHDGEAYARIMARKDASEVFATWILLLQIASRCEPRGTLVRDNGQPLDAQAFSLKTRAPELWFTKCVPILASIGWVECKSLDDKHTAPDCHPTDADLTFIRQEGGTEGKGMEEKEGKEVGRAALAAPASDSEWLAELTGNPAYQGIDVKREHGKMQAWCTANRKQPTRRRFINWLNRAERPLQTSQGKDQRPPVPEPEAWRAWLKDNEQIEWSDSAMARDWAELPRHWQEFIVNGMRRTA